MKIIELLLTNKSLISVMEKNNIRVKDIEMLDVVQEAYLMSANGEQKSYIVQALSDKYRVSVRSIYSALNKFKQEVTF